MSRMLTRRAVVLTAVAAGVVGAVGGAVAGVSVGGDGSASVGTGAASTPSAPGTAGSPPTGGAGVPAEVLWADGAALHDGDVTVPLNLVDPPRAVHRIEGGWLVLTEIAEDTGEYQASVVREGREPDFLAATLGLGGVSPDGTRYVGGTEAGYDVWDLATGEVVDSVRGGRSPSQIVAGDAQFVDDDTVATAWSESLDALPEVLVSDLGSADRRPLATRVFGEWGISPDGRWYVGSLAVAGVDGGLSRGCVVVRAVDGSVPATKDCGGTADGPPSFAADSSAVLSDPGGQTSDGPGGYRLLPLGDAPDRGVVSAPSGSVSAGFVGSDRVAVVPSRAYDPSAVVLVCSLSAPCQEVGRSDGSPRDVALGS